MSNADDITEQLRVLRLVHQTQLSHLLTTQRRKEDALLLQIPQPTTPTVHVVPVATPVLSLPPRHSAVPPPTLDTDNNPLRVGDVVQILTSAKTGKAGQTAIVTYLTDNQSFVGIKL